MMEIPLHGVTLSFLLRFIDQIGGKEEIGDYTTEEICETFIKPYTEKTNGSFCDMLRMDGISGYAAKANIFVSHTWLDSFVDLVTALADNYDPEEIFWIDIFSLNQNTVIEKDFNWWNNTFKSTIGEIGKTVFVLVPWTFTSVTRAWCIYEVYCTVVTKSTFEVVMTNTKKTDFLFFLKKRGMECVNFLFEKLNGRYDCYDPEDLTKILEIANIVGFSQFNQVVIDAFRRWMLSVVLEEVKEDEKTGNVNPFLISILAHFYEAEGNTTLAEERWKECLERTKNQSGSTLQVASAALARLAKQYLGHGEKEKAEELFAKTLEDLPEGKEGDEDEDEDEVLPLYPLLEEYCSPGSIGSATENHGNILVLTSNFAKFYEKLQNFPVAEKLYLSSLERCKLHVGENAEETLSLMNKVANIYLKQMKYDEAESLFLEARDRGKAHLGEKNQISSDVELYLPSLYMLQGKWEKAESFFIKAYEERRESLGEDHKDTLKSMQSLAVVYHKLGNFPEAERLYFQCVIGRSKTLGDDDPDTLTSKNILARLYLEQGKYEEAEALLVDVKDRGYKVFGEDHVITSTALQNLFELYQLQGQGDKLVALFEAAIERKKGLLGEHHEDTIEARYALAKLCEQLGKDEKAEILYHQCFDGTKASLGEDHPETLKAMNMLGFFYSASHGLFEDAMPLFAECLKRRRAVLGNDHKDTITSMFNLATVYLKLSDSIEPDGNPNIEVWLKSAEQLLLECVDRSREVLGDDHPLTLMAIENLSSYFQDSEY